VLNIALSRASTITIGIIVTTLVFSLTDFGGAREDLARRMLHIRLFAIKQAPSSRAAPFAALSSPRLPDSTLSSMRRLANPSRCGRAPLL
jgi:hypothetical protein